MHQSRTFERAISVQMNQFVVGPRQDYGCVYETLRDDSFCNAARSL